ncbi:MAG TPA: hypothetical protein VHG32_20855, partial [Thermoanaerobaculia bacterium]|nr:hypothetical protein [Thermoanaerobaculia bacterium]
MACTIVARFADDPEEVCYQQATAAQVRRGLCQLEIESGRHGWPRLLFHTDPGNSTITVRPAAPPNDTSPVRIAQTLEVAARLSCQFSSTAVPLYVGLDLVTGELTGLNVGEAELLAAGEGIDA